VIAKSTTANAAVIARTRVRSRVRRGMGLSLRGIGPAAAACHHHHQLPAAGCQPINVLSEIYLETLRRCAPERLIAKIWRDDFPRTVVAIGKCAGALRDGVDCDEAFVVLPDGYRTPEKRSKVVIGGHAHDDLTFLVSGGGSACVEVPLPPRTREELVRENARLIASGLPIGEINAARKAMSAIKGGKLAQRVRGRCVTLVYSDVSRGAFGDVASGPTIPGSDEVHLIADNATLVETAAEVVIEWGFEPVRWEEQIECDVETAAQKLASAARELQPNQILVAGGEPTVIVRGSGKGGRCSELAVRFALSAPPDVNALFASSDGVDGNSGAAGVELDSRSSERRGAPSGTKLLVPSSLDRHAIATELRNSNSSVVAFEIGRAIMIPPAGNNLRDLYLLARG
jgi:glycerate-2-kinase